MSYIGKLLHHIKNELSKFCKEFYKENFNIKLVFTSFKIKLFFFFSYKDPIPDGLKSLLLYKFTCAGCSSSYIGETYHHFKTRIEEHIRKDNKSHNFKHLHSTKTCFDSYNSLSFKIIDEFLHINWKKPNRTTKAFCSHSFTLASIPLFYSVFIIIFFSFRFHLFFIISTLIISIL